ncbi:MAG: cytochrome c maturation protein CcmE [Peptococcaceae bacterium]
MEKKARLLLAVLIIIGVIGYLIYFGMEQGVGQVLTIEEALQKRYDGNISFIQMEGRVDYSSVVYEPDKSRMIFNLSNDKSYIAVVFDDVKPDNFDSGYPVIVEGRFLDDGRFSADKLLVKCPAKYEEEIKAGGER